MRVFPSGDCPGKPVAKFLVHHSLQDTPPDLVFGTDHFVTHALEDSGEVAGKANKILGSHANDGAGTYTDNDKDGLFFHGFTDLGAGIHNCKVQYTLVKKADHTYTLDITMSDKFNFELSNKRYGSEGLTGIALTVANNIGWMEQHKGMMNEYEWTAKLKQQTGTW